MDDATTDKFIEKILDVLPTDGVEKLNAMIDRSEVEEASLNELLKQYNVDVVGIIKAIKEEK